MSSHVSVRRRRIRTTPLALAAGIIGTVVLSLSMTGTLSSFTASITNSADTAGTGSLVMKEALVSSSVPGTQSGATCSSTDGGSGSSSATCSTINKFGGDTAMTPGGPAATTQITLQNTGTSVVRASALTPGACSQSATAGSATTGTATDLCAKIRVGISTSDGASVFSGTAKELAAKGPIALAAPSGQATVPYTFVVSLDSSADNSYQSLTASMPLTWTFTS